MDAQTSSSSSSCSSSFRPSRIVPSYSWFTASHPPFPVSSSASSLSWNDIGFSSTVDVVHVEVLRRLSLLFGTCSNCGKSLSSCPSIVLCCVKMCCSHCIQRSSGCCPLCGAEGGVQQLPAVELLMSQEHQCPFCKAYVKLSQIASHVEGCLPLRSCPISGCTEIKLSVHQLFDHLESQHGEAVLKLLNEHHKKKGRRRKQHTGGHGGIFGMYGEEQEEEDEDEEEEGDDTEIRDDTDVGNVQATVDDDGYDEVTMAAVVEGRELGVLHRTGGPRMPRRIPPRPLSTPDVSCFPPSVPPQPKSCPSIRLPGTSSSPHLPSPSPWRCPARETVNLPADGRGGGGGGHNAGYSAFRESERRLSLTDLLAVDPPRMRFKFLDSACPLDANELAVFFQPYSFGGSVCYNDFFKEQWNDTRRRRKASGEEEGEEDEVLEETCTLYRTTPISEASDDDDEILSSAVNCISSPNAPPSFSSSSSHPSVWTKERGRAMFCNHLPFGCSPPLPRP